MMVIPYFVKASCYFFINKSDVKALGEPRFKSFRDTPISNFHKPLLVGKDVVVQKSDLAEFWIIPLFRVLYTSEITFYLMHDTKMTFPEASPTTKSETAIIFGIQGIVRCHI